MRRITVCIALIASTASFAECKKDEFNRYVAAAVRLYEALEYERALEQLGKAKESSCGTDDDAMLGMYEGTIRSDLGQADQAKVAFKEALLLKPDAEVPLKVSPKVKKQIEALRAEAKKELAPILARQEEEKRKREAEEAKKAEEARRAEDAKRAEEQRRADELRRQAETAKTDEARRRALDEAQRLDEQRRLEDLHRAELDAQRNKSQVTIVDRPEHHDLTATGDHPEDGTSNIKTQLRERRVVPVMPIVFGILGIAAGGVATWCGLTANDQQNKAIMSTNQPMRNTLLQNGNTYAIAADVLIGVAGLAALVGVIGIIALPHTELVAEPVK
jgi:tetratricopeptide (TPR) repeat protein